MPMEAGLATGRERAGDPIARTRMDLPPNVTRGVMGDALQHTQGMRGHLLVAFAIAGCAATDVAGSDSAEDFDFSTDDDGKSDGGFNQNNILSDDLFTNAGAMTADDVQLFFE